MKTVAWFSAGVSSAVATKLVIDGVDQVIYTHIDDQHEDTLRFVKDCEQWFGKEIEIIQSIYKNVEEACLASGGRGYINGPSGAACTKFLKKRVRKEWEATQTEPLRYVWGMDYGEKDRCDRLFKTMPKQDHVFPLVERKMTKEDAHKVLTASGIKRPEMYELGYHNNNCVGCVKGGMGYWNRIRQDFPEVFEQRAKMERVIQATCIKGVYLDELDPERGRHAGPIVGDCGILCEEIGM
jgi:3'-phosphoadenosine 5'-phosphosulfate sulfotransferase (PAPS reductase)/FAD synthetase